MSTKQQKMPVFTIIIMFLLLGNYLVAALRSGISFLQNVKAATQLFDSASLVFRMILLHGVPCFCLLCSALAVAALIISLFRKRCGKLMIGALLLAAAGTFLGALATPLDALIFKSPVFFSLFSWLASPISFTAYLLLALFVMGAAFRGVKLLTAGARYLFFLPAVLQAGASVIQTIAQILGTLKNFQAYEGAGVTLTPFILLTNFVGLFVQLGICLLLPIALLLLGLYIKGSPGPHADAEEETVPTLDTAKAE